MSISEDRTVQPPPGAPPPGAPPHRSVTLVSVPSIADPGPLGLAAFALTTFLLSAKNANWMTHATGAAFLGFALAYGGLAQLAAAMWEFRNRNVVGATAFGTFGAFWIGIGFWDLLIVSPTKAAATAKGPAALALATAHINHDRGWILLGFAIFTLYVLILVTQTNTALFTVFLLLFATLVVLCIGSFNQGTAATSGLLQTGGYLGLATALAAWYTSAAGMAKFMGGKLQIPLGPPLIRA